MTDTVLVTNDDGFQSELFSLLCEELSRRFRVVIVAPDWERSWTGKSQTVTRPVVEREIVVGNTTGWALSGRPADCVNIGIYHLLDTMPALVVSGINMGTNCGAAFAISSGTIGACFEANIAGVPALAFSQYLDKESYLLWKREKRAVPRLVAGLKTALPGVMDKALEYFELHRKTIGASTLSFNLPIDAHHGLTPISSRLSDARYYSCFQRTEYGFSHRLERFDPELDPTADIARLLDGWVTVTHLNHRLVGNVL